MSNIKENETLKKINDLLKSFNTTFDIKANLSVENGEVVADGLIIESLKNNGVEFVGSLHDTFNTIVQSISSEHEVIYDETKGLVIAKKIVKTDFVIEEF